MELPSLWTRSLFSEEAVGSINALTSLGGDREPALEADPDVATFSFPLPELKVEPAHL
jgi:hypothetical protein